MAYSKHVLAQRAMSKAANVPTPTWGAAFQQAKMSPEFIASLAGAGVSLGVAGVAAAGSKLKEMYDRNKSYKEMLSLTPSLRSADQGDVKRYFNSLHRMNPHFMNDPLIAGAHVHRVIETQRSMGGAGEPASALATMAGELAKGRSDFTSALQREQGMRRDYSQDLRPIIEKGILETGKVLQGTTDAAKQIAQLEAKQKEMEGLAQKMEKDDAKRTKGLAEDKLRELMGRVSAAETGGEGILRGFRGQLQGIAQQYSPQLSQPSLRQRVYAKRMERALGGAQERADRAVDMLANAAGLDPAHTHLDVSRRAGGGRVAPRDPGVDPGISATRSRWLP